jgi:Glutaminase
MIAPLLVVGLVVLGIAAAIAAAVAIAKLVAAGEDADKNFFTCPVGSSTQSCPLRDKALTPEQAQQWFDRFKNDRPNIPFDYPVDCCYTRAREMAKELEASGVPVGKVWNYASGVPPTPYLRVPTTNVPLKPDGSEGEVTWGYHVAPIVPVKQPDGSVQPMVIDPSTEPGPVTIDKWKADQNDPNSKIVETSSAPYYRAPDGKTLPDPGDAKAEETLADHRRERAKLWAGTPGDYPTPSKDEVPV